MCPIATLLTHFLVSDELLWLSGATGDVCSASGLHQNAVPTGLDHIGQRLHMLVETKREVAVKSNATCALEGASKVTRGPDVQAGSSPRSAGAGRDLRLPAGPFHCRGNFAANSLRWKYVPNCLLQMYGWFAALGAAQMAAAVNAGKGFFFFESCCNQTVIDG